MTSDMTSVVGTSKPQPITKLLIANRNEIAVRIIRAAKQLGIDTVAVYSDADKSAPHVAMADEAWAIGPAIAAESYLRIDKLIDVAKRSGADAIHPGYGFVSENPALPTACQEAGIRLVGPGAKAMADMADKARAKQIALEAGLPCIPGFNEAEAALQAYEEAAERIGYPVMVKALAGGGGRGMRLVSSATDLATSIHSAKQEALGAFGDDRVMLEKAVLSPRHVEIQVLADQYGHAIHLGERDCTVQRRHQKIIEEAPSPAVDDALRQRMGDAALKLVNATGYIGAGTVEFLLDERGEFFFIEMNTRLQVEHGVTELITGVDLVQWQLRIAGGEQLTLQQTDIVFDGHAIQGRLCAEDPAQDFLPQSGKVLSWREPVGSDIRVDHALKDGLEVPPWYDSMVGKVMAHGPDRLTACARLAGAFKRTCLVGFEHNCGYLQRIVQHPVFLSGRFSTAFLAEQVDSLADDSAKFDTEKPVPSVLLMAFAGIALGVGKNKRWPRGALGFSSTTALSRPVRVEVYGSKIDVLITTKVRDGVMDCQVVFPAKPTKEAPTAQLRDPVLISNLQVLSELTDVACLEAFVDGAPCRADIFVNGDGLWVQLHGHANAVRVADLSRQSDASAGAGAFSPVVKSPMSGKVLAVHVAKGDTVRAGDILATLEAMKMEHRLCAKHDAIVTEVAVAQGDQMAQGQVMINLGALTVTAEA